MDSLIWDLRAPQGPPRMTKWMLVLAITACVAVLLWRENQQLLQSMQGAAEQKEWVDVLRYAESERAMAAVMFGLASTADERAAARARFEVAQASVSEQLQRLRASANASMATQLQHFETQELARRNDLSSKMAVGAKTSCVDRINDHADDLGLIASTLPDPVLKTRWQESAAELAVLVNAQASRAERALRQAMLYSLVLVGAACAAAGVVAVAAVRSGRQLVTHLHARASASLMRESIRRRRIEDEQLLQEKVIRASRDGVLIFDARQPGMPITYANEAICEMTGYTREEFIRRDSRFLFGPATAVEAVARLDTAIAEKRTETVVLRCYRNGGTPFWNLVTLVPIADAAGVVTRFVSFQRDVTALKQQEQERVTAQRLAALGELAGGIAHDFNNLLSAITGMCDLLREQAAGQEALQQPLTIIGQATMRGANQVRRLMNLTRAPVLSPAAVDLQTLGAELWQLLSRCLPKNIELSILCDDDARWVASEPAQLESALLNLVLNARHALPDGGWIRIRAHRVVKDGQSWVRLCVHDNGVGMDETTRGRVFDPFFTTREPGSGSGLGLAMVLAYVTNLGGRISVRSELGRGTSFELLLPSVARPAEAATAEELAKASQLFLPPAEGATALLVDDDDVVRVTAHMMLERLGYEVIACADSTAAMAVLRSRRRVDLLLTDFLLPGDVNGAALGRCARLSRPVLVAVLMSGWTEEILPADDLATFDAFLGKPFMLDQLKQAIHEAMASQTRPSDLNSNAFVEVQ